MRNKMTKEEKAQFIEGLYETLKTQALEKVDQMPEDWDAYELREYVKDKSSEVVWSAHRMPRGRKMKYNNTIRITTL